MAELDNVCGKISRVFFVIINIILSVIGTAAIALGSYVVHTGRVQGNLTPVIAAGAILITVGIIVILIIAAGLYGAMSLSKVMLGIYIFNVSVIVLIEIVATILGFVYQGKIVTYVGNVYLNGVEQYRPQTDGKFNGAVNSLIDALQDVYQCCGWNDTSANWNKSPYFQQLNKYPESCECETNEKDCILSVPTAQTIWGKTCKDSAGSFLKKNLGIIGGVGAAIALVQLIPLFLAIVLMCTIRSDYRHV